MENVSGMEPQGGSVRSDRLVPGGQSGQLFATNGCGGGRQVVDHQSGAYAAGSSGNLVLENKSGRDAASDCGSYE